MPTSTGSSRKNTNREGIRRGQQAGRRQATKSTQRITQYLDPDTRSARAREDDVSVNVPGKFRRYFAMGLLLLIIIMVVYAFGSNIGSWKGFALDSAQPVLTAEGAATPLTVMKRIGLVSGHRGNDSGAVCKDGLQEAQVNYNIAKRVSVLLENHGYQVDILDEFDVRLKDYHADALLSIHADSCTFINELATGFKVARVFDSRVPAVEDRLVACLTSHYRRMTGLKFHANTVTFDMTKYHAFYEINAYTPAAIIETGFMYLDRELLDGQPDLVAQGIYNGLICFINNDQP